MRVPFAWWWPVLAGALTLLAVRSSSDYSISVPAAVAAVVVAAIAVGETLLRLAPAHLRRGRAFAARPTDLREWFSSGEIGREDLLILLDRLERRVWHPDLPARTPQEVAAIVGMDRAEFRKYVAERVARLEGAT